MPKPPKLHSIAPFFIVDNLQQTLDFYNSKLGFETVFTGGGDDEGPDYYGMVKRDDVMLMLKAITPEIHPQPNHTRHPWARWDAYIYTPNPDFLYAEYLAKSVPMHSELADTSDGLRAFEVEDNNGYVLCFGRPQEK